METTIGYLNQVHGDLLAAATRERRSGAGRPPRRPLTSGLVAAGVAVLVAAGLVGAIVRSGGIGAFSGDESAPATAGDAGSTGATGATGGDEAAGGASLNDFGVAPQPTPATAPEDQVAGEVGQPELSRVIRTAELSVVVPRDEFDRRFADAVDAAETNGGYVQDSRTRSRAGIITIRVPADNFDETLRAVRGLGTVEVESIHGRDVTAEYVDLRARLRIGKSRREVLLGLMGEAVSIEQTIRVQNALDETQLRIEQIQGQLRLLDDRTSLATITLNLREQGVNAEVETPSIPNAFERSVAGFVGVVAAIVIGLGYLLPLVLIGLACWFVWTRIQRRRETG